MMKLIQESRLINTKSPRFEKMKMAQICNSLLNFIHLFNKFN